ncbi:TPA: opacity family porin, partial [Neisseria gonorrhoeae]
YARYRKWNNNKYSVNTKLVKIGGDERLRNEQTLKTEHQENGTFHAVSSLGLSTIYDFDTGSRFKPYIGMRVAYGHVRHQVRSVQQETEIVTTYPSDGSAKTSVPSKMPPKPAYHENRSSRRLGFGAMAGAVKYPNRHSRQHRNLETRHSRAGGNLDLSVQELIGQNGFLRF